MGCSATCAAAPGGFRHEALVHGSDEELLAIAVPFLDGAAAAGEPALLGLPRREEALVLRALGDPGAVTLIDARRPATPLAALRERHALAARLTAGGTRRVRMLGTTPREPWPAWARYEAAVNHVLGALPVWALCPYDTRTAPARMIEDVERTHPARATADLRGTPIAAFRAPLALLERDLRRPDPLEHAAPDVELRDPSPSRAGRVVGVLADATGLGGGERDAVRLAAQAVVANAIAHGRPPVVLRAWTAPDRVVVTVSDAGAGPADPLQGVLPSAASPDDDGALFQVREAVADVALFRAAGRFTVRLVQRPPGWAAATTAAASSHAPSRRCSWPAVASCVSASVTVGRREPTSSPSSSCESRSGITTPSGVTRPQRSARWEKSATSRCSTRGRCRSALRSTVSRSWRAIAACTASWSPGQRRAATRKRSSRTARRTGVCARKKPRADGTPTVSTSSGPSRVAAVRSPVAIRLTTTPSRTIAANGRQSPGDRSGSIAPRSMRSSGATTRWRASSRSWAGTASSIAGSRSSSRTPAGGAPVGRGGRGLRRRGLAAVKAAVASGVVIGVLPGAVVPCSADANPAARHRDGDGRVGVCR